MIKIRYKGYKLEMIQSFSFCFWCDKCFNFWVDAFVQSLRTLSHNFLRCFLLPPLSIPRFLDSPGMCLRPSVAHSQCSLLLNIASWALSLTQTQCFLWPQCTLLYMLCIEQFPRNIFPSGSSIFLMASIEVFTSDIVFYSTRYPHLVFHYIYIFFKNVYLVLGFYYHRLCFHLLLFLN